MPLTLADIQRWDASAIRDVSTALGRRGASANEVHANLGKLPLIATWQGSGGDAARASLDQLSGYLAAHGDEMARVSSATRNSADDIEGIKATLQRINDDATREGFHIDAATGEVTPLDTGRLGDPIYMMEQADLMTRIKALLASAEAADADLARALTSAGYDAATANQPETRRDVLDALSKPLPSDPKQFDELWRKLTPAERDLLYQRDHSVGNHDGMPSVDRDYYNRQNLGDELRQAQDAQARVDALTKQHPEWAAGHEPNVRTPGNYAANRGAYEAWKSKYDAAKGATKYLSDLQAVNDAVKDDPSRKLMLLDTRSGEQARAAVAVGDPDTADHVSVTAPGLNTTVHGAIGGMADEATHLRQEALTQLDLAGRGNESVAAVAWIGYDAPQVPGTSNIPETIAGGWDVSHDDVAKAGARDLAHFYDGLNATHHGDLDLTAIGHSYGSLTTGLALQEPGNHGVDNALFYGSPGIEATTTDQLGLQPGHVFTMETPDDPIQAVYDGSELAHRYAPLLPPPFNGLAETFVGGLDVSGTGDFGPNPATNPNFTHLATETVTAPDGRTLEAAHGHSDYPRWDGAHNQPYTTGYNIAAVIAGTTPIPQK